MRRFLFASLLLLTLPARGAGDAPLLPPLLAHQRVLDLGHLLMARVAAHGLGLKTPDKPLAAEWVDLASDPLYALVHDRRALRSEAWLPHVGYTLGTAHKSNSVKAAERVAARLQEEIEILAAR